MNVVCLSWFLESHKNKIKVWVGLHSPPEDPGKISFPGSFILLAEFRLNSAHSLVISLG